MNRNLRRLAIAGITAALAACNPFGDFSYLKDGEPHAEDIVRSVSQGWNADKLIEAEDPRMSAIVPAPKIRAMIADAALHLGSVRSQRAVSSETGFETDVAGRVATYLFELDAEKGTARVTIKMQQVGDQWKVLGFGMWFAKASTDDAAAANSSPPAQQPVQAPAQVEGPPSGTIAELPKTDLPAQTDARPSDADLLTRASVAEREKRLYAPAGDNAIEYYLALRDRHPDDQVAKAGLTDLFPYAAIATEQNLAKGNREEATRIFALLERIDPNAPSLARLRAQIQKAPGGTGQDQGQGPGPGPTMVPPAFSPRGNGDVVLTMPKDFPGDVHLPAASYSLYRMDQNVVRVLNVSASAPALFAEYEMAMRSAGWEEKSESQNQSESELDFQKGDRQFTVELDSRPQEARTILRLRGHCQLGAGSDASPCGDIPSDVHLPTAAYTLRRQNQHASLSLHVAEPVDRLFAEYVAAMASSGWQKVGESKNAMGGASLQFRKGEDNASVSISPRPADGGADLNLDVDRDKEGRDR